MYLIHYCFIERHSDFGLAKKIADKQSLLCPLGLFRLTGVGREFGPLVADRGRSCGSATGLRIKSETMATIHIAYPVGRIFFGRIRRFGPGRTTSVNQLCWCHTQALFLHKPGKAIALTINCLARSGVGCQCSGDHLTLPAFQATISTLRECRGCRRERSP
jgi:hypothetical protein